MVKNSVLITFSTFCWEDHCTPYFTNSRDATLQKVSCHPSDKVSSKLIFEKQGELFDKFLPKLELVSLLRPEAGIISCLYPCPCPEGHPWRRGSRLVGKEIIYLLSISVSSF